MVHRHAVTKTLAAAAVLSIGLVSVAPAANAATRAQSEAQAANVSIAGNGQGTDPIKASHDGSKLTRTGGTAPALGDALLPKAGLNAGVLHQDATATKSGTSAACAGLAGDGAAVVEVGEGNCLKGGDNLNFELGKLDLDPLVLAGSKSPLAQVDEALKPLLSQVTPQVEDGVKQVLEQIGANAKLEAGAIQAWCTASDNAVKGNGEVTQPLRLNVSLTGLGKDTIVVNIPVGTAPNTKILTNLDEVSEAIVAGVRTQLDTMLDNKLAPAAGPLGDALQTVQDQVIETVVENLQPALQPLEQNVLDGTINKQNKGDGSIEVTALDLRVLPAAAEALGTAAVVLEIGRVKCGPNARPEAGPKSQPRTKLPAVPTRVTSGTAAPVDNGPDHLGLGLAAAGALLVTASAGGVVRRRLHGRS